jgi:aminoglycoside phosphotransferase family enzyme
MLDDSALDEKAKGEVLRQAEQYYDLARRYVRGDI